MVALPAVDLRRLSLLTEEDFAKARAEKSLSAFIAWAWPIIEPGTPMLANWHIDLMAEELEAVTAGDTRRLVINIPPRHMKSITVTVMWPCWEWTTKPETRFLFASYSGGLSVLHSLNRRTIIESDQYQARWGDRVQLSDDLNTKAEFQNTRKGLMSASSFGGTVLGKGGTRLVIDDPMNPEEAHSAGQREVTWRFYSQTLSTRLNDKKRDPIVVVMQRLHEEDLTGRLLELGFRHVRIPAEAEERTVISFPRSGRELVREQGDLLWPEREGPVQIAETKKVLGPYGYAAQYQQRPSPAEGGIFKLRWWRFYDPKLLPLASRAARRPFQFMDTAKKKGQANDFSVCATWGSVPENDHPDLPPGYYLFGLMREKLEFPELKRRAKELRRVWRPRKIVIEDASSGTSLAQSLIADKLPVELFSPDKDKEARAHAVSGYVEAGLCYLPLAAEWRPAVLAAILSARPDEEIAQLPEDVQVIAEFLREHRDFPNAPHDDMVDTTTMMLSWFELQEDELETPFVNFAQGVKGWGAGR